MPTWAVPAAQQTMYSAWGVEGNPVVDVFATESGDVFAVEPGTPVIKTARVSLREATQQTYFRGM